MRGKSLQLKEFQSGNIKSYLWNSGLRFRNIVYRTRNTSNNIRVNELTENNIMKQIHI